MGSTAIVHKHPAFPRTTTRLHKRQPDGRTAVSRVDPQEHERATFQFHIALF